jgi:hypothetical protein
MDDYNDLSAMRKAVYRELMEWKVLMKDLAGAFHRLFPATRKYGWTLHLDICARAKNCAMCPHSLTRARYCHVALLEKTKEAFKKKGKEAPNSKMSWDNTKHGTVSDGMPKRLMVSPKDRQTHKEFEAARAMIMRQHTLLSSLHQRLLGKERYWEQGRSIGFFDGTYGLEFLTVVLPSRQIKIEVIRKIQELRSL